MASRPIQPTGSSVGVLLDNYLSLQVLLRRSVHRLQQLLRHSRGEKKTMNSCRNPIFLSLPKFHLVDINSYFNSCYVMYIVVGKVWR